MGMLQHSCNPNAMRAQFRPDQRLHVGGSAQCAITRLALPLGCRTAECVTWPRTRTSAIFSHQQRNLTGMRSSSRCSSGRRSGCRQRDVQCMAADGAQQQDSAVGSVDGRRKHVLVLGGTGRVGSSTAASLLQLGAQVDVSLSGRRPEAFDKAVKGRPELKAARFRQCDIDDAQSLAAALKDVDLLVHAAGPFQRRTECNVLEACIAAGVPYMDVCDDADYTQRAKGLHQRAIDAGVPAITSTGIYPGTSNLMAAHMISTARKEYDDNGDLRDQQGQGALQPQRLRYSYYTAGSGGVGPTILETSMLLAGEEVVAYRDNQKVLMPPVSGRRIVDFGIGLGRRTTFLYNLPEVASANQYMKVPSVSARFGTAPEIWNWAMWLTARLSPQGFLQDRNKSKWLASLADPWVRLVDQFIGEKVAMLVEVELENGNVAAGLFMHKLLSDAVGHSISGFAMAMLEGETQPGVWFPEEPGALQKRQLFFERATRGCQRWALNKPTWALESNPRQLGFGIYY